LDGLNDFGILFRIILPLSKPVIATILLFNMVFHWNDWFTGTFFVRDSSLKPASTLLQEMLTTQEALSNALLKSSGRFNYELIDKIHITGDSLKMATIVLVVLPVLLVFPFVQKHFAQGVSAGALKE
jgi:putative aldouronate transport system permease protein